MKRLPWVVLLSVVFIFIFAASAFSDDPTLHPVMHPDKATRQQWIDRYRQAPLAHIEPRLNSQASASGSVDLRSHLVWNSSNMSQRDQKYCGNCWVWSGTGVMEVALDVQNGIKDRLSEQFLNSCRMGDYACCGGWLYDLVNFYDPNATYGKGFSVPWSNSGANWQDGWRTCGSGSAAQVCSAISTSPKYAVSSIADVTISTQDVASSTAVDNVKNVLNQNKAVWFGFFMPTGAAWTAFDSFWNYQPESTVWTPNVCGQSWNSGGGGHAVLCVGYDDTDANNRYWVMLNSWGANSNRPNGLFRVSMDLNYGCKDAGNDYTFYFQTLNVAFSAGGANQPPYSPSNLSPADDATGVSSTPTLSWTGGDPDGDAVTYQVLLDTTVDNPITPVCSGPSTSCTPGTLANGMNYYWRVVATDVHYGTTTGPVWHFRTNQAPDVPSDPSPAYGATDVTPGVTLSWTGGDQEQDAVTYRVVLDTAINNPTTQICNGSATSCATGTLAQGTDYYWRVYATDEHGASTTGPVWHFRTADAWNDDFGNAIVITHPSYQHSEDTTGATRASDDPSITSDMCGGSFLGQGSHSVWFEYTPTTSKSLTVTTVGSNYDTVLAVWKGAQGALQSVACNDDIDVSTNRQSLVQFTPSIGTSYYFEVVDWDYTGNGGTLNLAMHLPLSPTGYLPIIVKDD